jgi:hypothetical protein
MVGPLAHFTQMSPDYALQPVSNDHKVQIVGFKIFIGTCLFLPMETTVFETNMPYTAHICLKHIALAFHKIHNVTFPKV